MLIYHVGKSSRHETISVFPSPPLPVGLEGGSPPLLRVSKASIAVGVLLLLLGLAVEGRCAPATGSPVRPERLMIVVVGPTSDPASRDELGVIEELNQIRRRDGLAQLRLGTMHFDQPDQARLCQRLLGLRRQDLVALALVELDEGQIPVRGYGVVPRVTSAAVQSIADTVQKWARHAGVAWPAVAPTFTPAPAGEVMTIEGIVLSARRLEGLAEGLWTSVRNEPLRPDRADVDVRSAVRGLYESAHALRVALERGDPSRDGQFHKVFATCEAFDASEPRYTLPPGLRPLVPPLEEAIAKVRTAYGEFNRLHGRPPGGL